MNSGHGRKAEKKGDHIGVGLVGVKPELQPMEQYRRTSLGITLQKTLDQMVLANKFTKEMAAKIILHFDTHMAGRLATATPRMRFRCEEIANVLEVNQVYKCLLKQCEINIKGIGVGKDNAVLNNVEEVRLELYPSAGIKKRHGSTIVIVKEKVVEKAPKKKNNSSGQTQPADDNRAKNGASQNGKYRPHTSASFNFEDVEDYGETSESESEMETDETDSD